MVALSTQLFDLTSNGLHYLQSAQRNLFLELEDARSQRQQLKHAPQTQHVLQQAQSLLADSVQIPLSTKDDGTGTLCLHDTFVFAEKTHEVEEAFVTWLECEVDGATARIYGQYTETSLTIEQTPELNFQLEILEEQSKANQKPGVLKRLSVTFPQGKVIEAVLRITVRKR